MKRKNKNRCHLSMLSILLLLSIMTAYWLFATWIKLPEFIYLRSGNEEKFDFSVPAIANIENSKIDLSKPVTLYADDLQDYTMKVKLFGLIHFKDTQVRVIDNLKLYPSGRPIGIYLKTKGVLTIQSGEFVGEDGAVCSPAASLKKGDYIIAVNGSELHGKTDLIRLVDKSEGLPMNLKIERNGEEMNLEVSPMKNKAGDYKLGIWVRDNAQGVGTLTYVDENGNFGALGHGINDIDVCELMEMEYGRLYDTDIIGIKKGEQGLPGEMTGFITYEKERMLGNIKKNLPNGIYGNLAAEYSINEHLSKDQTNGKQLLSVGLKQDVKLGSAKIYCTLEDVPEYYDIQIKEINLLSEAEGRSMKIEITDPKLLEKTGGIIQGMSGSPIIQDGKIIGAVTHVLVNDPTRGYGIFIENMLQASS